MATWSREQSQEAGRVNPGRTFVARALGNLQPVSDKQKRYLRKVKGISKPFATDAEKSSEVVRVREFNAPMRADWKPARKRRGVGCRLSDEKRAAIATAREAHDARRAAFFASLEQHRHE